MIAAAASPVSSAQTPKTTEWKRAVNNHQLVDAAASEQLGDETSLNNTNKEQVFSLNEARASR
jgi:hypothetical protein